MSDFRMPHHPDPEQEGVPEGYTRYRFYNNGAPGGHADHSAIGHNHCGVIVADIDAHNRVCPPAAFRRPPSAFEKVG